MRRVLLAAAVVILVAAGGLYAYLPGVLSSPTASASRSTTSTISTTSNTAASSVSSSSSHTSVTTTPQEVSTGSTSTSATISTSTTATTTSVTTTTTVTSTTTTSTSTTTFVTTTTTTTSTTTTTTTTTTTRSSTSKATVFFYFSHGSAVYLNDPGKETNVTVTVVNNGSTVLSPKYIKDKAPKGTQLVSGSWKGNYYDPSGNYICTVPRGAGPKNCAGVFQKVADGGHISISFLVTGATVGETLTLTYSANGVTETIHLTVTG